jgi:hypothetical protein
MSTVSLQEAADKLGASKADVWRAIRAGSLSAQRTGDGGFAIDSDELFRVFERPPPEQPPMQPDATASPPMQPDATASSPPTQADAATSPPVQPDATTSPSMQPDATTSPPMQPDATASPPTQPETTASPPMQPDATASPASAPETSATPAATDEMAVAFAALQAELKGLLGPLGGARVSEPRRVADETRAATEPLVAALERLASRDEAVGGRANGAIDKTKAEPPVPSPTTEKDAEPALRRPWWKRLAG